MLPGTSGHLIGCAFYSPECGCACVAHVNCHHATEGTHAKRRNAQLPRSRYIIILLDPESEKVTKEEVEKRESRVWSRVLMIESCGSMTMVVSLGIEGRIVEKRGPSLYRGEVPKKPSWCVNTSKSPRSGIVRRRG